MLLAEHKFNNEQAAESTSTGHGTYKSLEDAEYMQRL